MNTGIEFAEKLSKAYSETCKPLCHELNIPQTAFDILLFLANNPEYKTARDIVEIRKIKANLVSVNVDKLVNEGYLERKSVEGDRRKVNLICTEKSKEIIQEGQKLQQSFVEKLFEGMDEDTRKALQKGMAHMGIGMCIAGCAPAFTDMYIEALGDAGVKYGLQRATAYRLAAKMVEGVGALYLANETHPGAMKDAVCSPGGTTIKGVTSLEESAFRGAVIKAVDAIEA